MEPAGRKDPEERRDKRETAHQEKFPPSGKYKEARGRTEGSQCKGGRGGES